MYFIILIRSNKMFFLSKKKPKSNRIYLIYCINKTKLKKETNSLNIIYST